MTPEQRADLLVDIAKMTTSADRLEASGWNVTAGRIRREARRKQAMLADGYIIRGEE